MTFRPDRPFNDLPALPPAQDIETKAVLKACIEARAALAELRVIARETAEMLADHDPPVLRTTIGQRVVFADAARTGRLAAEVDPASPAAREITALATELAQLGIGRDGS